MKIYGNTRSTTKPEAVKIDEYSVWFAKDIREVEAVGAAYAENHMEYEYELIQYDKDEYIELLDSQLTDTQIALCEIYERTL